MLGLASAEDPEPVASAQEPPPEPSKEFENTTPAAEVTPLSNLVPDSTFITNPTGPLGLPSNDMQVDRSNITSLVGLPQEQTPIEVVPPKDSSPPKTRFTEKSPPVSEPPQPPSWDPISYVGDEEEEDEEEIPSINMESDSD
jgi:hypothetical protein